MAFQITIVVVSALMAIVIIAFLLFCISIYQIKPTFSESLVPMQSQQWKDANGKTTLISPTSQAVSSLTTGQRLVVGINGSSNLEPCPTNHVQPFYGVANPTIHHSTATNEPLHGRGPVHLISNQAAFIPTTIKLMDHLSHNRVSSLTDI